MNNSLVSLKFNYFQPAYVPKSNFPSSISPQVDVVISLADVMNEGVIIHPTEPARLTLDTLDTDIRCLFFTFALCKYRLHY